MNTDDELSAFLGGEIGQEEERPHDRVTQGVKRTRTSLGQQQTMGFILIKLWVAVAGILAPLFAGVAKRQAEYNSNQNVGQTHSGEQK